MIRALALWTNNVLLPNNVILEHHRGATVKTPKITGSQLDIKPLAKMERMQRKMEELKVKLKISFKLTLMKELNAQMLAAWDSCMAARFSRIPKIF